MDKNISDNDRIVIGVREWAIQTALGDKWVGMNLVAETRTTGETNILRRIAAELEEYVLGGIRY